ncbi:O-acyltransferase like protein-like isoform X2 [Sitophilus oryzae]|nr:O-acyltransferase like protein-like isoform X2 [Sitophilus oryzae]
MYSTTFCLFILFSLNLHTNVFCIKENKFLINFGSDYGVSIVNSMQKFNYEDFFQSTIKSEKCLSDLKAFYANLKNITDDGMWALKMIDATAKIPSGILNLNLGGWMGSFDECINIHSKKTNIRGNYCLGTIYIDISQVLQHGEDASIMRKAHLFQKQKANFQQAFPTASYPSFGICIPDGCKEEDLQAVVLALNITINLPFECQTFEQANPPLSKGAWITVGFFALCIVVLTSSTAYDIYCEKIKKEPSHALIGSYSVYSNGKKLFRIRKSTTELSCLHGIKVLSMMWVVAGHTFSIMITGPVMNSLDVLKYIDTTKSMIFANAVHSVDTFLMVTGLLVMYSYMKSRHQGSKFNLLVFYLHRYIRLTPPFLAAIIISMTLLKYMGSGPHWSFIVNYFQGFCEKSWWSALLYLQNYINVQQWCIGQTWYLNIDWQLYLCSPIFLLLLSWKPKLGQAALFVALVTFIIVPFYITWVNELPALITNLHGDLVNFQNKYYLITHTRASPWFVGALMGYLVFQIKFGYYNIKLNKVLISGIWLTVLSLIPICIFVGHKDLTSEKYNKYANAFYNSLVRPLWASCIGWIVFACTMGYGGFINSFLSLPIFQVLSRFTYSIYLLHVTILYMITYAAKSPAYFSIFHVAYSFWGITMMTFVLSTFWVLTFESPVIVIEKYFLDKYKTKTKTTNINQ